MASSSTPGSADGYRSYMLTVLTVILAFNYVDRLALGILLQDIKVELRLSDTELGFLTGMAFALFYAVMGIPIARWADRGNRVQIISLTTALWSAAVALCGLAAGFGQLIVVRIAAAVGEAGCIPPAHSLIADYFERSERPKAVARYMVGAAISYLIGYFLAGWLNELYGWRTTFVLLGLPGLFLALLAWLTLKEPRVNANLLRAISGELPAEPTASLKSVFKTLFASATFRHLLLGFAVVSFFGYGISQWKPAFFIRSYGLSTGELGAWMAVVYGVGGTLGLYCGGELATRFAAGDERLQLIFMAIAYAIFGLVSSGIYLVNDYRAAFALMAVTTFGISMATGPLFATIQTLVPDRMRATSLAIIYLFANLVGMGLGPLLAGVLSDAFRALAGEESLRYALLALCPGYVWAAWHLWRASGTVERDLVNVADR